MSPFKTSAKVAVVTGATSGIGRAVALAFASKNLSVAINGFGSESEIEQVLKDSQRSRRKRSYTCTY